MDDSDKIAFLEDELGCARADLEFANKQLDGLLRAAKAVLAKVDTKPAPKLNLFNASLLDGIRAEVARLEGT